MCATQGMGSTHFLPQIVGMQQAMELLLTGKTVSGEAAQAMGLVLRAVDQVRAREAGYLCALA